MEDKQTKKGATMLKTKKELKEISKDLILGAVIKIGYTVDDSRYTDKEKKLIMLYVNKEICKLEKKYGYIENSWLRG